MLVLVLMLNLVIPVFAQTTTLTTTVPDSYLLHLEIQGEGKVAVNDVIYEKSADILVPRNTVITLTLYPKEGYHINGIVYNGDRISADSNNSATLPNLTEETFLKIKFSPISTTPTTGDSSNPLLRLMLFIISLMSIVFLIGNRKNMFLNK